MPSPDIQALRERLSILGQAHVLTFWEQLEAPERDRLAQQLARLEPRLPTLIDAQQHAVAALDEAPRTGLDPVDAILLPSHGGDSARRQAARQRGEAILAEGRVAVLVVAGGQGTRLGFLGPKGAFPIGPVTERSLFELQAQKIAGLVRRFGSGIPWYVMTSEATDAATREFFESTRYFGLPPSEVFIFPQGMVPAFDFEGRLVLERRDRVFENPDGHGGSFTALEASGALKDMERRGIDTIFYYQVDNPLIRIGDPVFLGLHDEARAEMSCKVVRKVDPGARVGVLVRVEGRLGVVEYTELDDATRNARDASGELVFWAGNPAIHLLSVDFVRRVAADADALLPFHASAKEIPKVADDGEPVAPVQANGYKLERFVFDALPAAEEVCVMEVSAREEFSPLKNASGSESSTTCRRDLMAAYRCWLESAGLPVPSEGQRIEIDHSFIDGPEDAAAAGIRELAQAGDSIRIAPGGQL